MKISIITVVYNAENEIKRTIESVLNQTVTPYEYLIIDGKSTDSTVEIVNSYEKDFEKKHINFRVVSEPDNGIYDAMNKGVREAKGEYIVFCNAGDWLNVYAVELFIQQYEKHQYDFAYGSINYIGKRKRIVKTSKMDAIVSSRNWNHPSSIVKRSLYINFPFDTRYKIYSDFDWYLKIRKIKNVKIHILSQ